MKERIITTNRKNKAFIKSWTKTLAKFITKNNHEIYVKYHSYKNEIIYTDNYNDITKVIKQMLLKKLKQTKSKLRHALIKK